MANTYDPTWKGPNATSRPDALPLSKVYGADGVPIDTTGFSLGVTITLIIGAVLLFTVASVSIAYWAGKMDSPLYDLGYYEGKPFNEIGNFRYLVGGLSVMGLLVGSMLALAAFDSF